MRMLATFAGVLGWGAVHAGAPAAVVTPDLAYTPPAANGTYLRLDLVTPGASAAPAPGVPTVILLHGGGYSGGHKIDVRPAATALADQGYNVVCPNYTLATAGTPSFPRPVADVLTCVRWVRGAAPGMGASRGLSPTVVVAGYSAGATIGVTAALASRQAAFYDLAPLDPRASAVDAVIGFFGRFDLVWNTQTYGVHPNVLAYLGVPMNTAADASLYARASAITYADPCAPPAALWHGDADTLVPPGNSARLHQALLSAGARSTLTLVPGGGHDIAIVGGLAGSAAVMAQTIPALLAQASPCPATLPPWGACCTQGPGAAPPQCAIAWEASCAGVFTPQAACSAIACLPPAGACCVGARCEVRDEAACSGPGVAFGGRGSACNPLTRTTPCCYADYDHSGAVNITDIFAYVHAWFGHRPDTATASPPGTVPTVTELFMFLQAWFAGC